MVKKIAAALLCVLMILSFIPFTVSAAESAAFKICVSSQDSKSVTITLDFADGSGFCALDASIKFNNLKLSLESCQFASGFAAFKNYAEKEGAMMIFDANDKDNPVKVSIASTTPFKKINNDGSILKIKFSKIEGANIAESDIALTIENCADASYEDIKASVSYDLSTGSSSSLNDDTVVGGKTPEEYLEEAKTSVSNTGGVDEPSSASQSAQQSAADSGKTDAQQNTSQAENSGKVDKGASNSKKTAAVIVIAIVCLGGIAALVAIIVKNKKSPAEYDD